MANSLASDSEVRLVLEAVAGARATGQVRERRWFHPFPARMPLAVVEHLIGSLASAEAIVLDPMAGSGMTLVGAKRLGRPSLGFDRDALASLIARAAVESFRRGPLEAAGERILARAQTRVRDRQFQLPRTRQELPAEDRDFLKYWFPSRAQKELFALAAAIREEPTPAVRDFAWVVFSSLIIAKAAGASYARDISRSRPHRCDEKPVVLPLGAWQARFRTAAARLPFLDSDTPTPAVVRQGDARVLPLKSGSVDFVLTSPPYLNAIDYLRAHKFSLIWMGHDLASLRELRGSMIGSERGLWERDGIPDALEDHLESRLAVPRRRAQTRRYLSDLHHVLKELARVLRPGGLAVLVLGPTIVNRRRSDSAEVVRQLAESAGLAPVGSVLRQINRQSRSLPPPGRGGGDLDLRMRREVIAAFRK